MDDILRAECSGRWWSIHSNGLLHFVTVGHNKYSHTVDKRLAFSWWSQGHKTHCYAFVIKCKCLKFSEKLKRVVTDLKMAGSCCCQVCILIADVCTVQAVRARKYPTSCSIRLIWHQKCQIRIISWQLSMLLQQQRKLDGLWSLRSRSVELLNKRRNGGLTPAVMRKTTLGERVRN